MVVVAVILKVTDCAPALILAVYVCAPKVFPRLAEAFAFPFELVAGVVEVVMDPPPVATAKVTVAPGTGIAFESTTNTEIGFPSAAPATPV